MIKVIALLVALLLIGAVGLGAGIFTIACMAYGISIHQPIYVVYSVLFAIITLCLFRLMTFWTTGH